MNIDREGILNEVFRNIHPQHRRFTAPTSGPFPPAAWATPRNQIGQQVPLVNRGEAFVRLRNYLGARARPRNSGSPTRPTRRAGTWAGNSRRS